MTYKKFVKNLPVSTVFADDAKLFKHITCNEDHKALQLGLNAVQVWSNKWLLKLNILKCKTVFFGRNINNKFVRPRWPYDMRPSAPAEKYMCVIVIR